MDECVFLGHAESLLLILAILQHVQLMREERALDFQAKL
jgi:hypothetical protein